MFRCVHQLSFSTAPFQIEKGFGVLTSVCVIRLPGILKTRSNYYIAQANWYTRICSPFHVVTCSLSCRLSAGKNLALLINISIEQTQINTIFAAGILEKVKLN